MAGPLAVTGGRIAAGRPALPDHAAFEPAKLAAILAMAVDHYGKIVDLDLFEQTHALGRIAFPLFAAIVGARLARDPGLAPRYLRNLVLWALASQPVYVVCGRDWLDLNIFFTLALGVVATAFLQSCDSRGDRLHLAGLAAAAIASTFVDYGPLGVAAIPIMTLALARFGATGLWLAGPVGLAANVVWALPPLEAADFVALAAGPVLAATGLVRLRLPRLPAIAFYAFYPAHLLAFHLWDLSFG